MSIGNPIEAYSQQQLLHHAMNELGMTPSRFAARLYIGGPTLHSWLLPAGAPGAKTMPESGKAYILEALEQDRTKRAAESSSPMRFA